MDAASGLESVACLCGNGLDSALIPAIDPVARGAWTYRRCAACGLERLSPRPVLSAMGQHYAEDYAPYSDPAPARASRADRLKRAVYETYFAAPEERSPAVRRFRPLLAAALLPLRHHSVLSFPPPRLPRRVFEFGAGTGADLVVFREAGWQVAGCEPSAKAVAAAAANGIALQLCNAEDAVVPEGQSCITMNNVFEHLHDPMAVLAKASASLLPGGVLVLIVPNHASWAAKLFGAEWPGYDPPRHLWGYTPASITGILQRAGFAQVSISQKFPLSSYCWASGLEAWRRPDKPPSQLRKRAVRTLGRLILLGGLAASLAGKADYIRVIAKRP